MLYLSILSVLLCGWLPHTVEWFSNYGKASLYVYAFLPRSHRPFTRIRACVGNASMHAIGSRSHIRARTRNT